ncbi:MAG: methylenetetrahydrofolate--tRNA-(uracil(54)-C(5))-methyltransferase (FADH(2)-oxidizing) TrmFO [Armatimonadota bacterium]|nr:methylenetetrahydrofolate--tRNA-(uracil(54)-C(5))-methyltransferase (FADH(2)-oxidizing) TrmFO [Armatimonadota bacterium]
MTETPQQHVTIVGAGLAGSEAAWQVAQRGVPVVLCEMRPDVMTPAHETDLFAELVCSNSLKSNRMTSAHGVLKQELRLLGSLIIRCADETSVPAGQALAVDRSRFAERVTEHVSAHPLIEVRREEVTRIPPGPAIIASGPLTSDGLSEAIAELTGSERLYFYDALSPIIAADSIDYQVVFRQSRYDKGEADYINCPFDREQYETFHHELINAETTLHADYDPDELFEGCLPIEIIASRGIDGPRYGPMRPKGLTDPRTGKMPSAVAQLRAENREGTMWNLVGFQTSLTYPEQRRVFRMIPGLKEAEFLRYGAVHRNTYINAPTLLGPTWQLRQRDDLLFAGQITGVEGYVESTGSGLVAGINAARLVQGEEPLVMPRASVLGALAEHITTADPASFQPMNSNFGLLPRPKATQRLNKHERRKLQAKLALREIERVIDREL